jgi:dihydroorotase
MRLVWVSLLSAATLFSQPYDIVLKGGHVIDPANGIDAVRDVAISAGRIAAVGAGLATAQAGKVVDVTGLYVVPGLIDMHAHVFGNASHLFPDDTALPTGVTTVVDAGGSGWRTFPEFQRTVMAHSHTRVLALINILGHGMIGEEEEQSDTGDMDPAKTGEMIRNHRDLIVGVKTAHFGGMGYIAIDRAREAGRLGGVPIMVDDKIFTNTGRTTREKLLDHLRPGDIHTHMFNDRQLEMIDRFTGKLQPYMNDARRRGVKFDMGHGAGSFLWTVAAKAIAQGFLPDTISTDLHATSIMAGQPDMPNCMSKMISLGMSLSDAVLRSTVNPAKEIARFPELGTLNVGAVADIAVLDLRSGVFALKDSWGVKRLATQKLEAAMTIRAGKILYEREGAVSTQGGPQEIYDILLRNAQVIDPANHRTGRYDVAVIGTKIARVGHDLPAAHARIAIDASRYYLTPGLIDIYAHFDVAAGGRNSQPDHNCLPYGVTTAVLAEEAKGIPQAKTRLLPATARGRAGAGKDVLNGSTLEFRSVSAAIRAGSLPETISTGLDAESVLLQRANMMTTLSKFLTMGMTPEQVIERTTANAARAIGRPELGTLSEGSVADIALIELEHGKFSFPDAAGARLDGDRRLRCVLTVRNGSIVWDNEGLSAPDQVKGGPYSNFK